MGLVTSMRPLLSKNRFRTRHGQRNADHLKKLELKGRIYSLYLRVHAITDEYKNNCMELRLWCAPEPCSHATGDVIIGAEGELVELWNL